MAYVLGNEGNGMEKEIIDICDQIAYIPITTIDSVITPCCPSVPSMSKNNILSISIHEIKNKKKWLMF